MHEGVNINKSYKIKKVKLHNYLKYWVFINWHYVDISQLYWAHSYHQSTCYAVRITHVFTLMFQS